VWHTPPEIDFRKIHCLPNGYPAEVKIGDFCRYIKCCHSVHKRMDSWEVCKFGMLVEDLSQLTRARGIQTKEQRAKTFARLVILQGKLCAAVRYLAN
jgi:hypothetical protein